MMEPLCILNQNEYAIKSNNINRVGINIYFSNNFKHKDVFIIFKGYLYNLDYIRNNFIITAKSIEENIIELYLKFGLEYTLKILDGVFSFILFDYNFQSDFSKLYIVSDICGILPIFINTPKQSKLYEFTTHKTDENIMCENASYSLFELPATVRPEWAPKVTNKKYFIIPSSIFNNKLFVNEEIIKWQQVIDEFLYTIIEKICTKLECIIDNTKSENTNIEYVGQKTVYSLYKKYCELNNTNHTNGITISSEGFSLLFPHNNQLSDLEYDYTIHENINKFNEKINVQPDCIYIFMDKQFINFIMMIPSHIRRIIY